MKWIWSVFVRMKRLLNTLGKRISMVKINSANNFQRSRKVHKPPRLSPKARALRNLLGVSHRFSITVATAITPHVCRLMSLFVLVAVELIQNAVWGRERHQIIRPGVRMERKAECTPQADSTHTYRVTWIIDSSD